MLLPMLALLATGLWPLPAPGQVRRCTASDGTTIFTDKACSELGATARLSEGSRHRAGYASRTRCMGSVQDLMFEMSMAFDAGDTNRLASLYHWAGMSSSTAYATIERLDRLVARPLVDIVPVMPAPPAPPPPPVDTVSAPDAPTDAPLDSSYTASLARRYADTPGVDEAPYPAEQAITHLPPTPAAPPPPRPQRPVGIKVVQTLSNGVTPSSTVFGLTRHYGCWWIRN